MKHRHLLLLLLNTILPQAAFPQSVFSKPHGLYEQPIRTAIKKNVEGSEIHYTIDGSEPTLNSPKYQSIMQFSGTTILRAAEFKNGERCTNISTVSYIFPESVLEQENNPVGYPSEWGRYETLSGNAVACYGMDEQMTKNVQNARFICKGLYTLPILSLVTDKDNLFGKQNDENSGGIYIFTGSETGNGIGRGWERPVSVELFGGPQAHDLSVDCCIKLHGGQSRVAEKNPKHSFRLTFKTEYGPSKLHYPLYGEDYLTEFNCLIVRNTFNDSWLHSGTGKEKAQYVRDEWARSMQRKLGHDFCNTFFVHVFLNGMYWGIYDLSERIDEDYCKLHLGGKKEHYDVIKKEGSLEASNGTLEKWEKMMELSEKVSDNRYYQILQGKLPADGESEPEVYIDVDNFIDYILLNQYMGNTDWDNHNWFAVTNHNNSEMGFKFICWDSETTFNNPSENVLSLRNKNCPTDLFNNLMNNKDFLHRYMDHAFNLLSEDGLLSPSSAQAMWDSLYSVIETAMYDESARWGYYRHDVHPFRQQAPVYTVGLHYLPERERMIKEYFPNRTKTLIEQLTSKGWYANGTPSRFLLNGQDELKDTLTCEDQLTLEGGTKIYYSLDGNMPVTWINNKGERTPSGYEYHRGDNLLDAMEGFSGWVQVRVVNESLRGWSPTVTRDFYIQAGSSIKNTKEDLVSEQTIYNLMGQRVRNSSKGIYIQKGRKTFVR